MSETTEGVELAVPDEAGERVLDLVHALERGQIADRTPDRWVRVIAAPVVAAELRRLAEQLTVTYAPDTPQIHSAMSTVRARADELEGKQ